MYSTLLLHNALTVASAQQAQTNMGGYDTRDVGGGAHRVTTVASETYLAKKGTLLRFCLAD